jgi:hypothetical protein
MSVKSFNAFINEQKDISMVTIPDILTEAAMDILNDLLASAEYKALLQALETKVEKLAGDNDDYVNIMKTIVPKLANKIKSDTNV